LHLSYIQNSKLDNSKAKEDISKSTAISIPKKINNHRFAHKSASSNNSKLNGSVEIAFSNKTTRPNNIKQKVVENIKYGHFHIERISYLNLILRKLSYQVLSWRTVVSQIKMLEL